MTQPPFFSRPSAKHSAKAFFAQGPLDSIDDFTEFNANVIKHSSIGFIEWRPVTDTITCGPSVANMLGYTANQLPLNWASISAHIFCDDYPQVKLFFANARVAGKGDPLQFRMIKADATVSWFLLELNVLAQDEQGQIAHAIVSVTNIDSVRESLSDAKALADNEKWLRTTIQQLLQRQDDNEALGDCLNQFCDRLDVDHIVLWQASGDDKHHCVIAKGHHQRLSADLEFSKALSSKAMPFEFAEAEHGKPLLIDNFDHSASPLPAINSWAKDLNVRSLAMVPIFCRGNIAYHLSLVMTIKTRHWAHSTIYLAEALGDALSQVATRRSVTRILELSEERFQHVLEATQHGIWDWDLRRNDFFVTPSFLYMLGYDEEFLPLNPEKISTLLFPPTTLNDFFVDSQKYQCHLDQVLQLRHRQGHAICVWMRAKPTEWESGKVTRVVGVNIDISRFQTSTKENASVSVAKDKTEAPIAIDEALRTSNILLVEDNPINQQVATGILKRKGAKITIANNGQEAIDTLLSSPPNRFDLVLMDMEMPVLDGYAATQLLRKRDEFRRLPIIALTAHAREEDRKNCLSLGMNDHVAKPVKPDILYAAIAKQLEDKNQDPRTVSH